MSKKFFQRHWFNVKAWWRNLIQKIKWAYWVITGKYIAISLQDAKCYHPDYIDPCISIGAFKTEKLSFIQTIPIHEIRRKALYESKFDVDESTKRLNDIVEHYTNTLLDDFAYSLGKQIVEKYPPVIISDIPRDECRLKYDIHIGRPIFYEQNYETFAKYNGYDSYEGPITTEAIKSIIKPPYIP